MAKNLIIHDPDPMERNNFAEEMAELAAYRRLQAEMRQIIREELDPIKEQLSDTAHLIEQSIKIKPNWINKPIYLAPALGIASFFISIYLLIFRK